MAPTPPLRAEFPEFTVRRVKVPSKDPWYEVHVAKSLAYLFSPGSGVPSDQPGWLGDIKFTDYDEAVAFGWQMAPLIRQAQQAHSEKARRVREVTDLIYREYGNQRV